jgi:multidrug transporter EmrE-like cation transporter
MNFGIIIIGIVMAAIDAIVLPLVGIIHTKKLDYLFMIIPMAIYAAQPILFKKGVDLGANVGTMNVIWDVISDIVVTILGIVILKESYDISTAAGIGLGIVSIFLLNRGGVRPHNAQKSE